MKIAAKDADSFTRRPPKDVRAVLVWGPDTGLVRERADRVVRSVVDDLADPFRVVALAPAALKDDPALLNDEAAAIALGGGRRAVRVRDATDALADRFAAFLDAAPGDAIVVVEAGALAARSRLRRLFEGAKNAAAIPCYPDEGAGLDRLIESALAERGLKIEDDARAALAGLLGGDRLATRSELDKLATYCAEAGRVTRADVEACVGDGAALGLDTLAIAVGDGDLAALDRALGRAWREGLSPVAVLRAVGRHIERLHRIAARTSGGESLDSALRSERPPLHFRLSDAIRRHHRAWPLARAERALERLMETEIACKTTGMPAETLCAQALMGLAWAAAAQLSSPPRRRTRSSS